ncbi:uncharacterized protein LOC110832969 isoform X4 [Zootermopsis nevadensis]|uniref:uncharacterized protein LOC110832969 isoform X4 n=1 Tax=Zootermopsis nevadensis TaxID=136037 RepID=UPI000B8ECE96|nr:uncharacterized protein LOC110832969 isoform X4 [Zootermopsis nevadensis]
MVASDNARVLDYISPLHRLTSLKMRRGTIVVLWVVLLVALLTVSQAHARPHRDKRQTDFVVKQYITQLNRRQAVTIIVPCAGLNTTSCGRRRRRSLEVLLQELRNPLTQDDRDNTADANANVNAMLADNSESDEDVRDYVESHQSLPEWYHAAQV